MKIIIFIWLCLSVTVLQAQVDSSGRVNGAGSGSSGTSPAGQDLQLAQLRKDIVPHSPEAEAMAKYDVLPVTLYTGMPNITIPIGEVKTPRLSVSFALGYNYNGYKPTESASWAGLGWSLQGGGVITRMVKGQVDEYMTPGGHFDDYASMLALANSQQFLIDAAAGNYDTEPDMYIFNVCGYTGKFVLIKGKAYLMPHQNLQISVYGQGFKLVDDKGTIYIFNDYETTYQKQNSGNLNIPYHKSAWYLSSITSADKKDVINFGYQDYSFKQPTTFVDSYTINTGCAGINTSCHSYQSLIYDGDHIDSKFLVSVHSNYGSILFGASDADRLDLGGSSGAKVLNDITVTGPPGSPFYKKFVLDHSYFGTNAKLRLDKVTVKTTVNGSGGEGTTVETGVNDYRFEYEDGVFPSNSTRGIDLFGYYNGANNSMLFPAGYFSPSLQSYADRSAHSDYSKIALLRKMTYPTGGYSTFDWEPNKKGHYNVTSQYNTVNVNLNNMYSSSGAVNGVTSIGQTISLLKDQDLSLTYQYFDGGAAPTIPIVRILNAGNNQAVYTSPALPTGVYNATATVHLPAGDYVIEVKCQQATGQTFCTTSYKDYVIDNTLADGPGFRIHKILFFDNLRASTDAALVREYKYNEGEDLTSTGFSSSNVDIIANCTPSDCAHNITQTTMQMSVKSALSDLAEQQFYYKKATEINRDVEHAGKTEYEYDKLSELFDNVKPITETTYKYSNDDFLPVKSTVYTYQSFARNSVTGFKVVKTATMGSISSCTWCISIPSPDITQPVFGLMNVYGTTGVYDLAGDYFVPSHTVEQAFNDAGTASLSSSTDYYYDNPDHQMPTRIVTRNSKGEETTAQMKYPLDYNFGNCGSQTTLYNNYVTAKNAALAAYGNCFYSLITSLSPYQPYNPSHQSAFDNVAAQYHCTADLQAATTTLTNSRNAAEVSYQGCLDAGIAGTGPAWQRSVQWMQRNNVVGSPIEKYISVKKGSSEYLLAATRNEFDLLDAGSGNKSALPATIRQVETDGTLLKSDFLSAPDNYYKPQLSYQYDAALNLSGQQKTNDITQSYIWGYANEYPIAAVVNADGGSIAYTSFESGESGNWTGIVQANVATTLANPPTGTHYLQGTFDLTKTGLSAGTYIVSYWTSGSSYSVNSTTATAGRQQDGWTYYEHAVTVAANGTIEITGTGAIDELRLYPKGAQMVTYTYIPSLGITSQCDAASRVSYYEYDNLGRLKLMRDQNRHILKSFAYQYAGY